LPDCPGSKLKRVMMPLKLRTNLDTTPRIRSFPRGEFCSREILRESQVSKKENSYLSRDGNFKAKIV